MAGCSALFRVENLAHIRAAYGEDVANELVQGLLQQLKNCVPDSVVIVVVGQGGFRVDAPIGCFAADTTGGQGWLDWLEQTCIALSWRPLPTRAGLVRGWVSAMSDETQGGAAHPAQAFAPPFVGEPVGAGDHWAARYRADMALSAAIAEVVHGDGTRAAGKDVVAVKFQPIRSACDDRRILYGECLSRLVDEKGAARSIGPEISAMERTGFVRLYDRYMADVVWAALEDHPQLSLGLNVSALSARWDIWWDAWAARVQAAPEVAKRLVVELTETARLADIGATVRFIARLRALGCRVALDDFGDGHAALRYLWALSPDIVKIDRLFLTRVEQSGAARNTFFHLARLAQTAGAIVVAEGVETQVQADMARELGVEWQQGYYWGQPSFSTTVLGHVPHALDIGHHDSASAPDDGGTEQVAFAADALAGDDDDAALSASPSDATHRLGVFKGLLIGLPISALLWLAILYFGGAL